jgi:hypothetical protein
MTVLSSRPPAAPAGFLSKRIIDMHPSLSHLENIDARFLDPNAGFVVMPETTEYSLDEARLALEGLTSIFESMEGMNIKLRQAGQCAQYVELPPDCLSALLRLVSEKITIACNNPTLGAMRDVRPDLFNIKGV